MRSVDVINLVTEDSIEHAMLHVLAQKQALADGVLDGGGDLKTMALPSGRRAMVDRLAAMLAPPAPPEPQHAPPAERSLQADLADRHGEALLLIEAYRGADGNQTLLVVLEADAASIERQRQAEAGEKTFEVVDRATWETIQRLSGAGVLNTAGSERRALFRSQRLAVDTTDSDRERLARSAETLSAAERKLRMALLLAQSGFAAEAMPALDECLALATDARRIIAGDASIAPGAPSPAPPRPAEEIAGSIESLLAEVRRSLNAARLAA